jgi:hypothetical protein
MGRRAMAEAVQLRIPKEYTEEADERLRPIIESWRKYGNVTDLMELARSAYLQGLMDGLAIEPTVQSMRVLWIEDNARVTEGKQCTQ